MKKTDLRKKIIDCLFLDRRTTGAIQDLEKLFSQELKREREKTLGEVEKGINRTITGNEDKVLVIVKVFRVISSLKEKEVK